MDPPPSTDLAGVPPNRTNKHAAFNAHQTPPMAKSQTTIRPPRQPSAGGANAATTSTAPSATQDHHRDDGHDHHAYNQQEWINDSRIKIHENQNMKASLGQTFKKKRQSVASKISEVSMSKRSR